MRHRPASLLIRLALPTALLVLAACAPSSTAPPSTDPRVSLLHSRQLGSRHCRNRPWPPPYGSSAARRHVGGSGQREVCSKGGRNGGERKKSGAIAPRRGTGMAAAGTEASVPIADADKALTQVAGQWQSFTAA